MKMKIWQEYTENTRTMTRANRDNEGRSEATLRNKGRKRKKGENVRI